MKLIIFTTPVDHNFPEALEISNRLFDTKTSIKLQN